MVLPLLPAAQAEGIGNKELYEKLKAINYTTEVYDSPEAKLETMTKVIENEGSASITKEYERTTSFLIGSIVDVEQSEESRERYFMFGDGSIVYVKAEADFKTAFSHLS